ncbi:hypothetical protein [Sunxiuqinia sp. sy24]|uniref:hypothetical protein n=1 Tax=Sunxiuqinia sp. sy24 TaxID=3461495 RepID=UPI0040456EF0
MKQLNKPTDNLGGLIKIWLVPPDAVSSLTGGTLTLHSTDEVHEIYCSSGSISFTEPMEHARAGILYKPQIKGFIPKDSPEVEEAINAMAGRKYLGVFLDGNEQYKVCGTVAIPLRVQFDLDTGADTPDRNGHSILLSGAQRNKSVFIAKPF